MSNMSSGKRQRRTVKQLFKTIFVVYASYSCEEEHKLSDYDFLPPDFNRPIEELFNFLLVKYPTFYSKCEMEAMFEDIKKSINGYTGVISPVAFFEYITTYRQPYNYAFCDLYLLACYLYNVWDDNIASIIDNYEHGVQDALKDPDIEDIVKTWKHTYNTTANFMNSFTYKCLYTS